MGLDVEDGIRLGMGGVYGLLSIVAIQRLTAFGCTSIPRPNRTFHLILAAFAAARAADMIEGALVEANPITAEKSIILSRLAICLFFSLCSQVVAQW